MGGLGTTGGSNFSEGVPVGHLEKFANVSQVFRRRRKDIRYDESELRYERRSHLFRGQHEGRSSDAPKLLFAHKSYPATPSTVLPTIWLRPVARRAQAKSTHKRFSPTVQRST